MKSRIRRIAVTMALFGLFLMAVGVTGLAQDDEFTTAKGMAAIGAGLAFLGGGIGTGLAQSRIIAAVLGAIAEDPGRLGMGIFLIAIPETILIFGFVMAFILRVP